MRVEVICEAGVNHMGDLDTALSMVEAAKRAGGDIVKFQTYRPDVAIHPKHPDRALLERLALPLQAFVKLRKECDRLGIEFLSTPGDTYSLKYLVETVGVKRIKIGSDDLYYTPLLEAAGATGLPIILSTGMAFETDIQKAVIALQTRNVVLLHCTSEYPCLYRDVNLRAMKTLRKFGCPVGFSDHTKGILASVVAAARGAVIIEKHFMLMGSNPVDAGVSIDTYELTQMIAQIRDVETLLGHGEKVPTITERRNKFLFVKDRDGYKRGSL